MAQYTEEAEVVLRINDKDSKEKFDQLVAKAEQLKKEYSEAFKKGDTRAVEAINRELQQTNRQIEHMRTNAANIKAAMQQVSATLDC